MPISFTALPDQNLLVTRYFDLVTDQNLVQCYQQVYASSGLQPGFYQLALHEDSEVLDISTSALLEVIDQTTRFHSRNNCTTRTIHVVGKLTQELMVDFYSSLTSTFPDSIEQVEVVAHVDEALQELGLVKDDVPIEDLGRFDFDHLTLSDRHRISELQELIDDKTMAIIEKNRKLLELASTDPLTKLLNRASIESLIEQEIDRFKRHHRPAVLALVDVDFFKTVNDEHGHAIGDRVLITLARKLQYSLRRLDKVGRWGGEEFLILLPETELDDAVLLLEQMRREIAAHDFRIDSRISISVGVAPFKDGIALEEIFKEVDSALYRAKKTGRNRVEVFE